MKRVLLFINFLAIINYSIGQTTCPAPDPVSNLAFLGLDYLIIK